MDLFSFITTFTLMGGPACGKGTQFELLLAYLKSKYGPDIDCGMFSTSGELRRAVENKHKHSAIIISCMNDGRLVPDDIVTELYREWCKEHNHRLEFDDGLPRTPEQMDLSLRRARSRGSRLIGCPISVDPSVCIGRGLCRERPMETDKTLADRCGSYAINSVAIERLFRLAEGENVFLTDPVDGGSIPVQLYHNGQICGLSGIKDILGKSGNPTPQTVHSQILQRLEPFGF